MGIAINDRFVKTIFSFIFLSNKQWSFKDESYLPNDEIDPLLLVTRLENYYIRKQGGPLMY